MKRLLVVAGLTLLLSGCAGDESSAWLQQVPIDPSTAQTVSNVLGQAALKVSQNEAGRLEDNANRWIDKNVPGGSTTVELGKQILNGK